MADPIRIGASDVFKMLGNIRRETQTQLGHAVDQSTKELHNDIRDRASEQGSGAVYPSAQGGAPHRASAPGEPPAKDTGSYHIPSRRRWTGTRATGAVFTTDERGPWFIDGTADMKPRPHFHPAIKEHRKRHRELVNAALKEAVRGSTS